MENIKGQLKKAIFKFSSFILNLKASSHTYLRYGVSGRVHRHCRQCLPLLFFSTTWWFVCSNYYNSVPLFCLCSDKCQMSVEISLIIFTTRQFFGFTRGLLVPFILQQRPQALHRQLPDPSLLHRGVAVAPQLIHSRPILPRPLAPCSGLRSCLQHKF